MPDGLPLARFTDAQRSILRLLHDSTAPVATSDLARRAVLAVTAVRWSLGLLVEHGLVRETKSRVSQRCGGKRAVLRVSFWALTARGRESFSEEVIRASI